MHFRHTAAQSLTHECFSEAWPRMKQDLYPLLMGSGEIALGLDATGMQGLNSRIRQYRDTYANTANNAMVSYHLHIYRDEAISAHYVEGQQHAPGQRGEADAPGYGLLPSGWIDYILTIDGEVYDADRLRRQAREWTRRFHVREGVAEVAFTIGAIRVRWEYGIAPDAVEMDYGFWAEACDGQAHEVAVTVRAHQTLRDGRPLTMGGTEDALEDGLACRCWTGSSETSTAPVFRPITIGWAVMFSESADAVAEENFVGATWTGRGASLHVGVRIVSGSDRDGTESLSHAQTRHAALSGNGIEAALEGIRAAWGRYFAEGADFQIGDEAREYVSLVCQYVHKAGGSWSSGLPLGTMWTREFGGATFWDTFFAADGQLRAGHVEMVRAFCQWLADTVPAEGRPHYWMTYYEGTPVCPDKAYQVALAYAQICVRLYEYTKDESDLRERVYPYLHKLARYALSEVLAKGENGWGLQGEVAMDVDAEATDATAEPGMLSWVVACLSKCADYADLLGEGDETIATCRKIDRWFREHPLDLSSPGAWGSWYPYLTGEGPHVDGDSIWAWSKESLSGLLMADYGMSPWFHMAAGAGCIAMGHPDMALELSELARVMIAGAGYLYETPMEMRSGGVAPYFSSTGAWLSSTLSFFAHSGIWDETVQVGETLPRLWRYRCIRWQNVHTLNGASVSGVYDPMECAYTVELPRPMTVRARIPARIAGEPVCVTVDGAVVDAQVDRDAECVVVNLNEGSHTIAIEAKVEAFGDVLLIEHCDHGKTLVDVMKRDGLRVHWVRDYDELPALVPHYPVIVVHESFLCLPHDHVQLLERAVQNGARLVALFHCGVLQHDREFAELCGTRAIRTSAVWDFSASDRTYALTAAGTAELPDLPEVLTIPATDVFEVHPCDGLQILAREKQSGQPVVTCRTLGDGRVYWLAAGNKFMNHGQNLWGIMHRDMVLDGEDTTDSSSDREWERSDEWQALFAGLIGAARA